MSISDDRNIPFYWGMTRKYIICFSDIFSDLYIQKFNSNNEVIKLVKVPYSYSTKDKLYYKQNKKDQSKVNLTLPRISYRFISMTPDSARANSKMETYLMSSNGDKEEFVHSGKPYNYGISSIFKI